MTASIPRLPENTIPHSTDATTTQKFLTATPAEISAAPSAEHTATGPLFGDTPLRLSADDPN
jgi:hypothetical protein